MSWQRSLWICVPLTGKWDEVGHGEVTINKARIIGTPFSQTLIYMLTNLNSLTCLDFK